MTAGLLSKLDMCLQGMPKRVVIIVIRGHIIGLFSVTSLIFHIYANYIIIIIIAGRHARSPWLSSATNTH
jgi:hypothetical protein